MSPRRRLLEQQLAALEAHRGTSSPLGKLHDRLTEELRAARQAGLEPTLRAVHDVPSIEDTAMERTFTSTFISRIRKKLGR